MTPLVLVPSDALARPRPRLLCGRVACALRLPRVVPPLIELPRVRVRWARVDVPTTPWARLRCAPSEAGRVNVLPHSGQVSAPSLLVVLLVLVDVARLALAMLANASFPTGLTRRKRH